MLSNRVITRILGQRSLASLLFGNGEDGFLFGDFSELDELFTTSTGPTNVASDSGPVGLALDDHGWGVRTFAQQIAQSPELLSNGDFSGGSTGWSSGGSWSVVNGEASATGAAAFTTFQQSAAYLVAGATYRVEYDCVVAANGVRVSFSGGTQVSGATRTASGHYVEYLVALTGNVNFNLQSGAAGFTGTVDNVSLKLVAGRHGLQATSGARPLWRANSGKPYLSFDGSDDVLQTPLAPSPAMSFGCAVRPVLTGSAQRFMGGGLSTGGFRVAIGMSATGTPQVAWGSENGNVVTGDVSGAWHVMLLSADGTSRTVYIDGVAYDAATAGGPMGSGANMAVGALNNNGSLTSYTNGFISAAFGLNRRITPAEAARITSDFQRTF